MLPRLLQMSGRVLVLGDGDLSFSRALSNVLEPPSHLTATVLEEDQDLLLQRYPWTAWENIVQLRERGARIIFGIDATRVHLDNLGLFDKIIFNFPQAPPLPKKRNQIQRHRALLADTFASAHRLLSSRWSEILVSLKAGQGGTALDLHRDYGNTWQIEEMAAQSGLALVEVFRVEVGLLESFGYVPGGYRLSSRSFPADRSLCHVFRLASEESKVLSPRRFQRDINLTCQLDCPPQRVLDQVVRLLQASRVEIDFLQLVDVFHREKDLKSLTYRVELWSERVPLYRALVSRLVRGIVEPIYAQDSSGDLEELKESKRGDI